MQKINSFNGEYAFLSNFAKSPIMWDNREWPTVEHLFQAAKTLDPIDQEKIRLVYSPSKAKKLGKNVKMRSDWEQSKHGIMIRCLDLKFEQNLDLRQLLINTGNTILIEGNYWHDNIWGNCYCPRCNNIYGKNILGKCLMSIRGKYV